MAADLDILISSGEDPLLNIEYHRHFSHALAFIPFGALLVSGFLFLFLPKRLSFATLYLYSFLGYATSGLLDACTSYGTQLLLPFSTSRVAWNIISVVDPIFTLPLLVLLVVCLWKQKQILAKVAGLFALFYFALGTTQNFRAQSYQSQLMESRGHDASTLRAVKPSLANLILWRSVYECGGTFYVDALRLGTFSDNQIYLGDSAPAFSAEAHELELSETALEDIERFDHFSEGFVAYSPSEPNFLIDIRYSPLPNSISPLWGIHLQETTETGHLSFETRRQISETQKRNFLKMIKGK